MTPERHQLATDIFLEACERAPAERAAFLVDRCDGDAELLRYVEKMLAQDELELPVAPSPLPAAAILGGTLATPGTLGLDGASAPAEPPQELPNSIGAYRIIDIIGQGGMGVVYLAEQERPRRTVALKVIKSGILTPTVLRRFEHEAQILGRLQHSGIAQIFEAGTAQTEQGRQPFFAMEYIDGRTITDYAHDNKLGVRERLELIARVCEAVQHAHQKGIIHRDLKPGNILVVDSDTSSGGERTRFGSTSSSRGGVKDAGQPKILDFGVARMTDSDIQITTMQTDVGQLLGTIPYMSPEQVSGDVNELDTRSDVYALGVLCYQILTGRLPHDLRQKFIAEAARIIREDDPASLSSINKVYRGDIDTIVSKALDKDKRRRYQSASDFAADIRHYLNDEPIVARPAGSLYQLGKFARRNKAIVTGVAIAFLALCWGLISVTIERDRALDAEKRALEAEQTARTEAEHATTEARKADRTVRFLQSMLAFADPEAASQREDITVVEAIALAARTIDLELADEPEVQAAVHNTIGQTLSGLAKFEKAEEHLQFALGMRMELLGERHEDVAETLTALGRLYKRMGRYTEAAEFHRRALDIQREVNGPEHGEIAKGLNNLGSALLGLGKLDEAEQRFREALEMAERCLGADHEIVGRCTSNVAMMLIYGRKYDEAETMYRKALDIFAGHYGERNVHAIKLLNNLAFIRSRKKDQAGAIEMTRKALEIMHEFYDENHPLVATTTNNLAVMLRKQGNLPEAEKMYREVIKLRRKTLGEQHPKVSFAMNNLGYLMYVSGRLDEAESVLRNSLEVQRAALPDGHIELINTLGKLSDVLLAEGKYAAAEPLLIEALGIVQENFEEDDWGMGLIQSKLGRCLLGLKRHEEAELLLRKALDIFKADGELDGEGLACVEAIVTLYEATGKGDQAGEYRDLLPSETGDQSG